jgi:glucokinase
MQVLAGDIGGTKSLLAIAEVSESASGILRIRLLETRRYDSRQYPGLAAIALQFARDTGRTLPPFGGFGVAGPVKDGRSHTTNLPWVLDERDLCRVLDLRSVRLANDFHALALGLPAVDPKDLATLNEGTSDPLGPWALIGAGTGLGEALSVLGASRVREVLATEGGHTDFAPRNELEIAVLRFLQQRYPDHVSYERILSGEGLVSLAEAIAHVTSTPLSTPVAEAIRDDRADAPAAVTDAATTDPACRRAVETFCSIYGAEAGNLALKSLATGGVFVAGGIGPRILGYLQDGRFREAFLSKGRMRPLLEAMPVRVVLDPDATVLGAAALAAQEATLPPQTRRTISSTPEGS